MDAYLLGTGLSIAIGLIKTCHNTPRSRREEEDEFYQRYGNTWALPDWFTSLPARLRGLGAWVAEHRRPAHNA